MYDTTVCSSNAPLKRILMHYALLIQVKHLNIWIFMHVWHLLFSELTCATTQLDSVNSLYNSGKIYGRMRRYDASVAFMPEVTTIMFIHVHKLTDSWFIYNITFKHDIA